MRLINFCVSLSSRLESNKEEKRKKISNWEARFDTLRKAQHRGASLIRNSTPPSWPPKGPRHSLAVGS